MRLAPFTLGVASLALAATAGAQQAPTTTLNQITRVEARGEAVEITCSGRPNFTSLNLNSPPRLVLDFSDTVLADQPREIVAQVPGLKALRTEAFRSDTGAVARVVLT